MANTWQGEFPWQNLNVDGFEGTSPVGSFPPNGYGLYDMCGNVWEWTTGAFTSSVVPSRRAARRAAPGDRFPRKVIKGGSHLCAPNYCLRYRPAARQGETIDTSTGTSAFAASSGGGVENQTCSGVLWGALAARRSTRRRRAAPKHPTTSANRRTSRSAACSYRLFDLASGAADDVRDDVAAADRHNLPDARDPAAVTLPRACLVRLRHTASATAGRPQQTQAPNRAGFSPLAAGTGSSPSCPYAQLALPAPHHPPRRTPAASRRYWITRRSRSDRGTSPLCSSRANRRATPARGSAPRQSRQPREKSGLLPLAGDAALGRILTNREPESPAHAFSTTSQVSPSRAPCARRL